MIHQSRNLGDPIENLAIGTIIEVDGNHVVAELDTALTELSRVYGGTLYAIGQFGSIVRIHFGRRIIYGYVSRLRMKAEYELEHGIRTDSSSTARVIELDLFGEGEWIDDTGVSPPGWRLFFERGVSTYPLPQQTVYLTPKSELKCIFGHGLQNGIQIGEHVGAAGTPCFADMNELLGKHTAVLGSTGAGKSAAVAVILHSVLDRDKEESYDCWNPRIILLDPHNEYGHAFQEHTRFSTDEGTLSLPYWLLNLDETISLLIGKTEFVATSQANIVRNALLRARQNAAEQLGLDKNSITVDSPLPYVLGDASNLDIFGEVDGTRVQTGFVGAVNEQRPSGKNKKDHEEFYKVLRKLETLQHDSRVKFMMAPWDESVDPIGVVLNQFFGDGPALRIVDFSGVPDEVAGSASAAIARTLFSVKLWQSVEERDQTPVVLVCEEAHRYVPDRGEAQYHAAQDAIRRLAKEGRKYGIGLMLVSQRPSEVEATVLSQCNTWLVLRVTNDVDRNHVRSILPDSLAGLTKLLSSLRRREAIFVGQAALLPSRILMGHLEINRLPRSQDVDFDKAWQSDPLTVESLTEIAIRWRYQRRDATQN